MPGKTTLLKRTLDQLGGDMRIGILEGDIATSLDADALEDSGAAAVRSSTPAPASGASAISMQVMVRSGLTRLPLDRIELLIIENVGESRLASAESPGGGAGSGPWSTPSPRAKRKPFKYPVMFRAAEVVVVNKMDLLPHLDFDLDLFLDNLKAVNPTCAGHPDQRTHRTRRRRVVLLVDRLTPPICA